MADEFDRVGTNLKLDQPVTIYQAEQGALINPAIVMGALASDVRNAGQAATVRLEIVDEFGELVARVVERGRIRPGMSVELTAGKIALRPGEKLRASCSPPGAVDLYVSLLRSGSVLGRARIPSREVYVRFLPPVGVGADPNIRAIDAPVGVSVSYPPLSVLTGGSAVLEPARIQAYFPPPEVRLPVNVVFVRPARVYLQGEAPVAVVNGATWISCPTAVMWLEAEGPVIGNGTVTVESRSYEVEAFRPLVIRDVVMEDIQYLRSSGTPATRTAATMTNSSVASADDFITGNQANSFIRMDLGSIFTIERVIIGTSTNFSTRTRNKLIQHSLDGDNWFTITNTSGQSNDTQSMPVAGLYAYSFPRLETRYIRLFTESGEVGVSEFYAAAPGQSFPVLRPGIIEIKVEALYPDYYLYDTADDAGPRVFPPRADVQLSSFAAYSEPDYYAPAVPYSLFEAARNYSSDSVESALFETASIFTQSSTSLGFTTGCVLLPDGKIFVSPGFSAKGYIYDPATNTSVATVPDLASGFTPKNGAVLMGDGRIFMCPAGGQSTETLIYDPIANTATSYSRIWGASLFGAVVLQDGRVFCAPRNTGTGILYNPETNTLSNSGSFPIGSGTFGTGRCLGAVLLPDGRVLALPDLLTSAVVYNPTDGTTQEIPGFSSSGNFAGGVLMRDGRVFCIPYGNNVASRIFNPSNNTFTTGPVLASGTRQFAGGVLMTDGKVFCVPHESTTARIYDPVTNTAATPPGTFPGNGNLFGGVLMRDGRVFCCPHRGSQTTAYIYGQAQYNNLPDARVLSAYDNKF